MYLKIVFCLLLMLSSKSSFANCSLKIGYGSSSAVLPKRHIDQFYLGFETALKSSLSPKQLLENTIIVRNDDTYDGAYRLAKQFAQEGFDLIVGFPSSHEATLAEKGIESYPTTLLSSGAATSTLGQNNHRSKSIAISQKAIAHQIYSYISGQYLQKKGVIILSSQQIYGTNLGNLLLAADHKQSFQKVVLEKTGKIREKDYEIIRESGFVLFAIYPNEAELALKDLRSIGYKGPIVGNTSWSVGEFDMFKHILKGLSNKIIIPEIVNLKKISPKVISNLKKHGYSPTTERVLGYDAGIVVSQIIAQCHTSNSKHKFDINICFKETSQGSICFKNGFAHGQRDQPITFTNISVETP